MIFLLFNFGKFSNYREVDALSAKYIKNDSMKLVLIVIYQYANFLLLLNIHQDATVFFWYGMVFFI